MQYRTLTGTDLNVSTICLGTMTWGQQNTEAEAHDQLDYAITQGINFLDTAEMYPVPPEREKQGRTEIYIGNWLAKRRNRRELIIASKVAGPSELLQTRPIPNRLDRRNILEAIDGSLQRLQTDYIDIYQVHWPERATNFFGIRGVQDVSPEGADIIEETLETMADIIKTGKVRYIGVSNETPWGVGEYLRLSREKGLPRIVSIQNQYSLTNRTYEIGLSEQCMREEVNLLAYSPLNMGALTGKYLDGAKPEGARFTRWERNAARYNPPHAQTAIRHYVDMAKKYGLDPAELAIAFVVSRPFVASTIIGATSLEQLKTDVGAGDVTLSADVLANIALAYKEMPDVTC